MNYELGERIRRAAEAKDMSISRYVAEVMKREVNRDWPEGYFDSVIGGWQGEPLERAPQGEYEQREAFAPED